MKPPPIELLWAASRCSRAPVEIGCRRVPDSRTLTRPLGAGLQRLARVAEQGVVSSATGTWSSVRFITGPGCLSSISRSDAVRRHGA